MGRGDGAVQGGEGGGAGKKLEANLQWQLKWGKGLDALLEVQAKTGVTPKGLQDRPSLSPEADDIYGAFSVLSKRRKYNQAGLQPLEVSEVTAYLTELGFSGEESREEALHLILGLDDIFMADYFKKAEKTT